jgi:hypothetical protein
MFGPGKTMVDIDASDLPTSDPAKAGKIFIDESAKLTVSAG